MNTSAPPLKPTVVIIAGPNGAGKSTAAPFLLKGALGVLEFVNADQIAVGLSAYAPENVSFEAGRIMLRRLHELARSGSSFAFESTLSSRTFAKFLREVPARLQSHWLSGGLVLRHAAHFRSGGSTGGTSG